MSFSSRVVWYALLTCLFIAQPLLSFCQSTPGDVSIVRDQKAMDFLALSVGALGGSGISSATTGEVIGQISDDGVKNVRTFDTRYRFGAKQIDFRKEVTSGDGTSIFASGGGKPGFQPSHGKVQPLRQHIADQVVPFEFPAIVFARAIQNTNAKIVLVDGDSPTSPLHIRIEDETTDVSRATSAQDWYFDQTTNLPIRVEYKLSDAVNPFFSIPATCDYLGFQLISGVLMPRTMRVFEEKVKVAEVAFTSVQLNGPITTGFDTVPGVN